MDNNVFAQFLTWITGTDGGAFLLVLWAVAWAFEDWTWFQGLTSKARSLLTLGIAVLLGIGSVVMQNNPDLVAMIEPYFKVVFYIVTAWLAKETAHRTNPNRNG